MIDWLQNPQAGYVLAAYAVAGVALMGLLAASLYASRRRAREWQALQGKRGAK